jgi:glyceraldehyde 3-phosphate dehydrogenase
MRIGINGFGRMGRLALRAAWSREDLEVVAVNEPNATAETMTLLLEFDSVQGRWDRTCVAAGDSIDVSGKGIAYSRHRSPAEIPWADLGVGLVLECSGRFKKSPALEPHFERGASRVVVSAPVKDGPPNIAWASITTPSIWPRSGSSRRRRARRTASPCSCASCTTDSASCAAP